MNPSSTVSLYTGNKMPVIGLGTWQLTRETAETLAEALKLGFRMIDTSGDYGTQRGVGEAIKMCDLNRNDLFISTKVEEDDNAYKASHQNLKELDLSYVELMLVHRPPKTGNGEDLWEGLRRAKRESLALDIGVSNYSIQKNEGAIHRLGRNAGSQPDRMVAVRPQSGDAGVLPREPNRNYGV